MMVSIVIPIFNAEKYLSDCFSSISNQTYIRFEVICVNDGSTDSSERICKEWCLRDSRFKLINQTNQGVSVARNKGVEIAKGEFCCFIDADDKVDIHFLEILVFKIQDKDLVICDYTRNSKLGSGGDKDRIYNPNLLIKKILFEQIKHPNIVCFLYRKRIIDENNLKFVEGCVKNEDTEFYLKYISCCKSQVVLTDYIGYYYRVNNLSATQSPITLKSLTSIEASRRIGIYMAEKNIIKDSQIELSNGVLTYIFFTARQNNREIYDYLHKKYNVLGSMKKMLAFPVIRKQMVALAYLLFGRDYFYQFVSHLGRGAKGNATSVQDRTKD